MKSKSKKSAKRSARRVLRISNVPVPFRAMILSIICGDDCDFTLPVVDFADCNPEVNESQIQKIYEAKPTAANFSDWTSPTEWAARLSQTSTDPDAIREYTVIGDKPKPEATEKIISGERTVRVNKKHTINFDIDESNAINHDAVRNHKCISQVKIWYQTKSGHLFGGNEGIEASIEIDMTLSRTSGDLILYQGTLKWDNRDLEERCVSPIAS